MAVPGSTVSHSNWILNILGYQSINDIPKYVHKPRKHFSISIADLVKSCNFFPKNCISVLNQHAIKGVCTLLCLPVKRVVLYLNRRIFV